jgi:hypothetical protein
MRESAKWRAMDFAAHRAMTEIKTLNSAVEPPSYCATEAASANHGA